MLVGHDRVPGSVRSVKKGIVSKRSGRTGHMLKVNNPKVPAVNREAEEEWS